MSDGRILIGEGGQIAAYAPDGTEIAPFRTPSSDRPLTQLEDGRILTAWRSRTVRAFEPDGTFLGVFADDLNVPSDALQLPDGRVLVAEFGENKIGRISVFDPDGTPRARLARGLANPASITLHPDGRVLVAEFSGYDVSAFAQDGTPLDPFATDIFPGDGILALPDGRVLITELGSGFFPDGDVVAFSADGKALGAFAEESGDEAFYLAQLQDGRVLVSYPRSGVVRAFGVVPVTAEPEPESGLAVSAVWPSPVHSGGVARLAVETREPGRLAVTVVDAVGREVRRQEVAVGAGRQPVEIGTEGLAAGAYAVRVVGPGVRAVRRLVVVR